MSIHDGDPAFPVFPETETGHAAAFRGMTLRDYFAAKAMQGMMADSKIKFSPIEFSMRAYAVADAMLKVREIKQ